MTTAFEYALMAGRIYQITRDKINWLSDLSSLGWIERIDKTQSLPSGFEATYFTKGNESVISFAGTGSNVDWWANTGGFFGVISTQLEQAADYYLRVKAIAPVGATISFTGHSMGGGLASLLAVFFGETAITFDQAPFRNSASVGVANTLLSYLSAPARGYSAQDLQGLTNFISAAANGSIPNEGNVLDFSVQGEILSAASALRIGSQSSLTHSPDSWFGSSVDLHSQALLTAFLQSDQTAPAPHSFRYEADRDRSIKISKNDPLRRGNDLTDLKPYFDPKAMNGGSIAIGYGFDLLVHSNAQIITYLAAAGLGALSTGDARVSISGFEFADGTTRQRTRAAIINSKAANDEIVNAWMVAA